MKKILLGIGGLIAIIIVVGLIAIKFLVNEELIKDNLITQAKQFTKQDVTIEGNLNLTFYPQIGFELFANGKSLGSSSYDVSDIPLNGRALMLSGMQVPLVGEITVNKTDDVKNIYEAIAAGESLDYRVIGQYTIETAWQVIDVQFDSSI